jgi:hypothetical protein
LLDTRTRTVTPIDFPPPPFLAPTYADGVVALAIADDAQAGRLLQMDPRGSIRVLAEHVDRGFARTQHGTVVYIERPDENTPGTLVRISASGERETIAHDVGGAVIPYYGTDRELDEVLYSVRDGGLWRYVLP